MSHVNVDMIQHTIFMADTQKYLCRRTSVFLLIIVVSILVVISYHLVDKPRRYIERWRLETFNGFQSAVTNTNDLVNQRTYGQVWTNAPVQVWSNTSSQVWNNTSSQAWKNASSQAWNNASSKAWNNASSQAWNNASSQIWTTSSQAPEIAATSEPPKRYLIYLCDGDDYCYGLGDRQRGLIGVFILAEVTNRQFGIKMTAPAPFRDFYEPNQILWDISEDELINKSTTIIKYFKTQTAELNHINFNQAYPQDVVYIRTNQELWRSVSANPYYKHKVPAWARGRRCKVFANAWLKLARPTSELRTKVNELLVSIGQAVVGNSSGNSSGNQSCRNCTNIPTRGNTTELTTYPSLVPGINLDKISELKGYDVAKLGLVCAHVRIGHSDTLPFENDRRNSMDSVVKVWDFLRPYVEKGHHVYLATDSDKVRANGKALFGARIHNIDAPLVHIASVMKGQDKREGLRTALVEQLLLMTSCDVLMVSKSGFSMAAAYVRMGLIGFKDNFLFLKGHVTGWSLW